MDTCEGWDANLLPDEITVGEEDQGSNPDVVHEDETLETDSFAWKGNNEAVK